MPIEIMNGLEPIEPDYSEFVEVDPTGRYGRYHEVLGKGASKTVYRGFDEYEGIEIAWNQVKLYDFLQSPEDLERLYCEIHLLKTLKHKNIMKFFTSWVDTAKRNINFVTEVFTSGTLRQYRERHKRVNIRAVKHWCRQILRGLLYLHSHDPPVIHRDLKCDNIFVNGNQGEVKIGDLGLAAILRKSDSSHCVGTPEFMAPEVYEEEYNELVDIYSFGMCILEMVTFEYPYSECTHPAQIYKKVISGKKPEALYKVRDPEVRQFVDKCLAAASQRLSARELLRDPFLQIDDCDTDLRPMESLSNYEIIDPLLRQPLNELRRSGSSLLNGYMNDLDLNHGIEPENGWYYPVDTDQNGIELFTYHEDEQHSPHLDITIKGRRREDCGIFLRLRITDKEGRVRNIYFPFDIEEDTAFSVATEMVGELDITDQDVTKIADMIDGEIAALVPDWRPGPGIDETPRFANASFCQNCASTRTSTGSLIDYHSFSNPDTNNVQPLQCSQHGCAAAMHGRFEEITYQVDESDHPVTEGPPVVSGQSEDLHHADIWAHQEGPELSSLGSGEIDSDEEHGRLDRLASIKDKNVISLDNYIEPVSMNSVHVRSGHSRAPSASMNSVHVRSGHSRAPSAGIYLDDYECEIRQELRWHKAKYQMELGELKNLQLGGNAKGSKLHPGSENWEPTIGNQDMVLSFPEQRENNKKFLRSFSSGKYPSFNVSNGGQNSYPNSEYQLARNCEASTELPSPEFIYTAKNFYKGTLLPNSLHRTTSLPVDAVD